MRHLPCLLVPWLLLALALPVCGQDVLTSAQALYAAAQYEDALKAFDALKSGAGLAPGLALSIEQGRAFCLLALDRKADAQQAIEAILDLDPFFHPGEDDAAPKIRAAFSEVRRRALPGAVQQVYSRAKQAYDRKGYGEAAAGFTRVLSLLDDPDLTVESGTRADMRLVAKAFVDLAEAAAAPPATAAPAPTPPAPVGVTAPAAATQAPGALPLPLHDASSKDVIAPTPIRTEVRIPDWMRPTGAAREVVVEILVSTSGTVESATVRQSGQTVYDALVTRSVMDWRYKPATKAGVPVRYRMLAKVVIPPPGVERN